MTPEERAGYENGIWMCRTHVALIDRDEKYFTDWRRKIWETYCHASESAWTSGDGGRPK